VSAEPAAESQLAETLISVDMSIDTDPFGVLHTIPKTSELTSI